MKTTHSFRKSNTKDVNKYQKYQKKNIYTNTSNSKSEAKYTIFDQNNKVNTQQHESIEY